MSVTGCGRLHAVPGTAPRVYDAVNGLSLALTLGETAHLAAVQIIIVPSLVMAAEHMYAGLWGYTAGDHAPRIPL